MVNGDSLESRRRIPGNPKLANVKQILHQGGGQVVDRYGVSLG